jgi:hydroxypyruvate reductase
MKLSVLQYVRLMPYLEQALAERYAVTQLSEQADPQAFLRAHGAEFQGLVTSAKWGAPLPVLDQLPALRVISSFGVGYDCFDLPHARAHGLQIGYTPDVLNECVADTAFGLLLDTARQLSASDRFVRAGRWVQESYPLTTKVSRKRLGIVGLGRIGRVIAQRASGFDMAVRYHNRRPLSDVPFTYAASLLDLAQWCDFLVVISSGGADTRHLISAEVLRALGPQGFLINVSRGSVVDEQALIQALQDGTIAGAGLDVYADEPHVPQALMQMDQVVLLPHVASATHDTRRAMADCVLHNLAVFFETGQVPVAVPL